MTNDEIEEITSFRGAYDFLDNSHKCEIELDGIMYKSVTHAFEASKTDDTTKREQINKQPNGSKARYVCRNVETTELWENNKIRIMRALVLQKFIRYEDLRQRLLETGNAKIIFVNHWGDTFWGVTDGDGKNHLGRMLMKVRELTRRNMLPTEIPQPTILDVPTSAPPASKTTESDTFEDTNIGDVPQFAQMAEDMEDVELKESSGPNEQDKGHVAVPDVDMPKEGVGVIPQFSDIAQELNPQLKSARQKQKHIDEEKQTKAKEYDEAVPKIDPDEAPNVDAPSTRKRRPLTLQRFMEEGSRNQTTKTGTPDLLPDKSCSGKYEKSAYRGGTNDRHASKRQYEQTKQRRMGTQSVTRQVIEEEQNNEEQKAVNNVSRPRPVFNRMRRHHKKENKKSDEK